MAKFKKLETSNPLDGPQFAWLRDGHKSSDTRPAVPRATGQAIRPPATPAAPEQAPLIQPRTATTATPATQPAWWLRRSTDAATVPAPAGVAGTAGPTVNPYAGIGSWYDARFSKNYGSNSTLDGTPVDLGRVYRQTSQGLISVDGRKRAGDTSGLRQAVSQTGETFWYDPTYFESDGASLRLVGGRGRKAPAVLLNAISTRRYVGPNTLGHVGVPDAPAEVYAWSPGKGLYAKSVDAGVWSNGGTVQTLIDKWQAENPEQAVETHPTFDTAMQHAKTAMLQAGTTLPPGLY